MLVLTRKVGETVQIGGGIAIEVLHLPGNRVKLGITAPPGTWIVRGELPPEEPHDVPELVPA